MRSVLVDTSVWVGHFRRHNKGLADLLALDLVISHPLIIGEIACGTPPRRHQTLSDLRQLRQAQQINIAELLDFIEREQLSGLGCGLVDLLLLASTMLTPGCALWTLDKRLAALAVRFGIAHRLQRH